MLKCRFHNDSYENSTSILCGAGALRIDHDPVAYAAFAHGAVGVTGAGEAIHILRLDQVAIASAVFEAGLDLLQPFARDDRVVVHIADADRPVIAVALLV